ncbi:DUF6364 family protein [Myxococcota bacterium]|nr:DUF6364 family protein [Myxococcota bacterium]
MKDITISVDENVARWAKVWAAQHDSSISKLVGELLKKCMIEESGYDEAMRDFFDSPGWSFHESPRYPTRDEVHDRDDDTRLR